MSTKKEKQQLQAFIDLYSEIRFQLSTEAKSLLDITVGELQQGCNNYNNLTEAEKDELALKTEYCTGIMVVDKNIYLRNYKGEK